MPASPDVLQVWPSGHSFGGSNCIFQFFHLILNLFLRPLIISFLPTNLPEIKFPSVIASGPRQRFFRRPLPRNSVPVRWVIANPILDILSAERFKTYQCLPVVYIFIKEPFQVCTLYAISLSGSQVQNMVLLWPVISMAMSEIHLWFITLTQFLLF